MKKHHKSSLWGDRTDPQRPSEAPSEALRGAAGEPPAGDPGVDPVVLPEAGGAVPREPVAAPGEPPGGSKRPGAEIQPAAEILAADYLDQLQRLKAEFDNYRKRTAREREEWFLHAQAELAEALLPVVDDVRRAREHEADTEAEPDGRQLILKRFEDTLEKLGLEKQGAEPGADFDPEQHDAVMAEASADIPEGKILRVLEPGYLFRGRLLRRSRVCYSTGPAGE